MTNLLAATLSGVQAMKVIGPILSVAVLLSSCSSVHSRSNPQVDLGRIKSFYVLHRLTDDNHIDEQIVEYLRRHGREADAGPLTMMPQSVEAVVTYQDDWAWDFKTYLIQLRIEIRRSHNNQFLAEGGYRQPSLITKPPAVVIERILNPLFGAPKSDRGASASLPSTAADKTARSSAP